MTDRTTTGPHGDDARLADHGAIDRLADDLVPALVARLAASGLGEIEVREGDWHVRLRMPTGDPGHGPARRAGAPVRGASTGPAGGERAPGTSGGAAAHGAPTPGRAAAYDAGQVAGEGWDPLPTAGGGRASGADGERGSEEHPPRPRAVATSPAVGVFRPRDGVAVGSRVRAGDRLGVVDVLGVPHDVLAPADGVIGGSYAGPGEGVEYGQELVRIELAGEPARGAGPSGGTPPGEATGPEASAPEDAMASAPAEPAP